MNPNPQQLERIVAYLDGELSPEESAEVERQLASDEQFRQDLQGAQRAWSALDQLPMTQVGDEFSRTTMELVVDAAKRDVQAQTIALPIRRRKRKTTNVLLIATTVLLGALAARIIAQNPNRRLLADLPVIHNVDIYSQFENVEFLRDLSANLGDNVDRYSLDEQALQASVDEATLIAADSNRKQWIESLTDEQQTTLRGKFNRFRELPITKQNELRALHTDLETDDDRQRLLQTMYVYQQWLNEIEPSEQYKLRELPAAQRASRAAEDIKEAANEHTFELTPEELKKLFEEVQPFVQEVVNKHKQKFDRTISERSRQDRKRFEQLADVKKSRLRFIHAMRSSPEHFREFVDTVSNALPADIRDDFWALHPAARQEIVFDWFRKYNALSNGNRRSNQVTEQELSDFFVEVLEPIERERLLAMPREEMQRQLRRMYLFKMPPPGRDSPLGEGPPGRWLRDRRDGDWRDRQGPPPRGERGGPPGFGEGPGGSEGGFDRRRGRPLRDDADRPQAGRNRNGRDRDDRERDDREGPPRRRRPAERPPLDDQPTADQPPRENE